MKVIFATVFLVICAVIVSCEDEPKICPFLAACIKETEGKVKVEDLKILDMKDVKEVENVPESILCVTKCALEKRQVLVDGKLVIDKIKDNKFVEKMIDNKEEYMKCVEKIEKIGECGDMKEFMKCQVANRKM